MPRTLEKFTRDSWLRALAKTQHIGEDGLTLPVLMERLAEQHGSAPALSGPDGSLSFRELGARIHHHARWALALELVPGDVVALLMENCAEYPAIWLGLTRVGISVALINTQLSGPVLAHAINAVRPRLVIADAPLLQAVTAIRAQLPDGLSCRLPGSGTGSDDHLTLEDLAEPGIDDTALYIYTSGTTGLPKAARVSHYRLMRWSHWFAGLLDCAPADRMFNCLPMYHSIGGVVAVFAPLVSGASVLIRRRFSASGFWQDVRQERCTLFQYIGELCRYLLHAPHQPEETAHRLRIACGNGLRPEVWGPFQERFRIPRIVEYYASTEGNFSLYNCEGKPGSVGRIPPFLANRAEVALLSLDPDTLQPLRDAAGRCRPCATDETGEAVGRIPADAATRTGRFEGYSDAAATSGKILRDVFESGDAWFRTGDLMRRDAQGFYYFIDRIGDTYRWKGENVSTSEVLTQLAAIAGVREGVVYGVAVPGADGRAGMAALVVDEHFDLLEFGKQVASRLPRYARPQFLRLLRGLESTGTFKPQKQALALEGFDRERVADPLFVLDPVSEAYVPLDREQCRELQSGAMRL